MRAIEKLSEVRAAEMRWGKKFSQGASVIGHIGSGKEIFWHERLGIWGAPIADPDRDPSTKNWNVYGRSPSGYQNNIIVEINNPPQGINRNIQGVFAKDDRRQTWLLHQGRMSVRGARVTEVDFIEATGLRPITVRFGDGSTGEYHPVANIDATATEAQDSIARFIARCSLARLAKLTGGALNSHMRRVQEWEHKITPERVGEFEVRARKATDLMVMLGGRSQSSSRSEG